MEPLTVLGVTSNVVQFVDFAGRILSLTVKIYRENKYKRVEESDHRNLERITHDLDKHNEALKQSLEQQSALVNLSSADKEILRICRECEQITSRLLIALSKLRSSKDNIWTSFIDALRTVWSENDVQILRQTLDSYRQQIALYLLASVRDEIRNFQQEQSSRDENLLTSVTQTRTAVEGFFERVVEQQLWQQEVTQAIRNDYDRKHVIDSQSSPAVRMQNKLTDEDVRLFNVSLLQWLRFSELDYRHEKISEAYEQTFEWIFRPPPQNQWSDFIEWLESNTDHLYWISGKPASGKSTIMKFIYADPRTSEHLRRWAQDKKLITSAFYFSNSGTQIQMSQEGMARTLLYETIRQAPELWASLFPHKMEEYVVFGSPWHYPITWEEIMKALRHLVKGAGSEYKLIFFIDGMDEFDGNHEKLIAMIQDFLSPHVKTCVSSRPWNVFEDSFQQRPSLRLEDLTYPDIKHFVSSRFKKNRGFAQLRMLDSRYAGQLIDNIIRKASGTFLWVSIVTDSLLDGLSDGERFEELQARLDLLPTDLEVFYGKILTRLDEKHLPRASELFQIIRASPMQLNLLTLSYADEKDPKFRIGTVSTAQTNARAELLRRRLNAYCKGLIESKPHPDLPLAYAKVGYLHRTVKDYVERDDIWPKFLAKTNKTFNPYTRLCNAYIIMLNNSYHQPALFHDAFGDRIEENFGERFWDLVTYSIEYATRADPECSNGLQPKLLNELNLAASHFANVTGDGGRTFIQDYVALVNLQIKHWTGTRAMCSLNTSFFHLAVECQLTDYIRYALSTASKPDPTTLSRSLLVAVLQYDWFSPASEFHDRPSIIHTSPNSDLIKLLLSHGADPNAEIENALLDQTSQTGAFSPWEVYLNTTKAKSNFSVHIGIAFLEYGGNPKLVSRKYPSEVYQFAKKKRREKRVSKLTGLGMVLRDKG